MDTEELRAVIRQKIIDFSLTVYQPIFHRDLSLGEPQSPKAGNLVNVVIGMRRSGKTYRLLQEIESLLARGIPDTNILYFNFEDDRLRPYTAGLGGLVTETFYELHPKAKTEGAYLFLDEVQEVPDWGIWLRMIVDTEKATIYVTGSSAKLLSADVATEFRGRSISCELLPFGFAEFIRFHQGGGLPKSPYSTSDALVLMEHFNEYLQRGGFPAIQGEPWERATGILQSYAQQVVARDVIERHNLSNPQAISVFSSYALAYSGRELSIRKSLSRMQSQGIKVGRSTLADALSYFEDAFLLATLAPYSRALADDSNAVVKVYAIDPGLARANSPATGEDLSQLLEDAVYLEFRRRNPHRRDRYISRFVSGKRSYEVDFVVDDSLGPDSLIPCQVCLSMQDVKTAEREIRALREAMAELGVSESLLVVIKGEEREIRVDEGVIRVVPAWQWCLEGST